VIEVILPAVARAVDTVDDLPDEPLFPQEETLIRDAVDGRRREFRTVRGCARLALAQLGIPRPALLPGERGAPSWPRGVVGSMTHCAGYRAAAVARVEDVVMLGVDAEPNAALPDDVLEAITTTRERTHHPVLAERVPSICWDRLLFSAKESIYKAWFPLTRRWLGFRDADIVLHPETGTFDATFRVRRPTVAGRAVDGVSGRWLVSNGLVLTSVVLLRP
jgi:4'-phosphopantetheinyl transferase EntD